MSRQPGYYWVKINSKWCAEWYDGERWEVTEVMGYTVTDNAFTEINENRILPPDEVEQQK